VNCSGNHTAWTRSCSDWMKQRKRADEAYIYRPRQFETAGNYSFQRAISAISPTQNDTNMTQNADNDGFIPAKNRKRKAAESLIQPRPRGRPAKETSRTEEPPRRGPIEAWTNVPGVIIHAYKQLG
jgi:hypothetical protein